jgi:hypothetical protein
VKRVVFFYFLDGEDDGDNDDGDEDEGGEIKIAYLIVPRPRFLSSVSSPTLADKIYQISQRVFSPPPRVRELRSTQLTSLPRVTEDCLHFVNFLLA